MVLNKFEPTPSTDLDNSTVCTAITPPETVSADLIDEPDISSGAKSNPSSVPWPGSNFIIRSVSSGHLITLFEGQIVLAQPGGQGSIHWACVETKGWLGFQNTISGMFLGHDIHGHLCCVAKRHLTWEYFCVRMRPEGGYVLLMTHWDRLRRVGLMVDQGVEKLAKIDNERPGLVWEFIKV